MTLVSDDADKTATLSAFLMSTCWKMDRLEAELLATNHGITRQRHMTRPLTDAAEPPRCSPAAAPQPLFPGAVSAADGRGRTGDWSSPPPRH